MALNFGSNSLFGNSADRGEGFNSGELNEYRCNVYKNGSIDLPVGGLIPFDAEVTDPMKMHDNATNNSRVYCRLNGYYYVSGQVTIWNNLGTAGMIQLDVVGTSGENTASILYMNAAATWFTINVSFITYMKEGEYLTCQITNYCPAMIKIYGSQYYTFLNMIRINTQT